MYVAHYYGKFHRGISYCSGYWSRLDPVNVVDSNQLRAQGDVALVLDRVLTLQYSASLWNLPQGATYTLRLQGPRGRLVDSVTFMVSPSSYATTATMVEVVQPSTPQSVHVDTHSLSCVVIQRDSFC